jgi:multidrug efflux pump
LPEEDQGYWISSVQLPADATAERTNAVIREYEDFAARPGHRQSLVIQGFGFSGSGPNAALMFTMLKDWDRARRRHRDGRGHGVQHPLRRHA